MNTEKKYVMIVTSEDERYGHDGIQLDFFWDNPWEGLLVDIVYGDSWDELFGDGHNEGLFYQLYSTETGERIGYGSLDPDSPREEIEEFEKNKEDDSKKDWKDIVREVAENLDWYVTITDNWFGFQKYSSAGQNFYIEVEANNFKSLYNELDNYYNNFDISYETYLWLDNSGHGKDGAPYEMIDVYRDMEECKEMACELRYRLSLYNNEMEN